MRKDYSAPVVTTRPARPARRQQEEEKQVDYTGLDILEQLERVLDEKLYTHKYVRASHKWQCKCPFPNCTSTTDSFLLWVRREVLEEGQMHYHCTHCQRKGDLINFYRQHREATTGIKPDWKEGARFFGINTRTWKVDGQGETTPETGGAVRRRQQAEQQHKAEQEQIALLGAWYNRARAWLAAGHITMKDGRQVDLETARAYLQERGFNLEQASSLGIAYIPTAKEAKEIPEIALDQKLAPWRGRILFPLAGPRSASGYAGRSLWKWTPGMPAEQHKKLLDAWNEKHKGDWTKQVQRYYKTRQAAFYGYEQACQARTLVIVEGEFDAASVRLALADLPDIAVCAFGKNFQARLVPLNVLRVVLALDLDQAGQEAIASHTEELDARGISVTVARPPAGKDWNDCLIQAGADAIRAAIAGQGEEKRGKERIIERADASPEACNSLQEPVMARGQQQRIEPPGYNNGDICLLCGQQVEDHDGAYEVDELGDMYCSACWARQGEAPGAENVEKRRETSSESDLEDQRQAACLAHVGEVFDGEINGAPVWPEPYMLTLLPAGMSSAEYIERWHQGERPGRVIYPIMADTGDQSRELASESGDQGDQLDHHCRKHGKLLAYSDEMGGRYCDHVDCWERYRLIRAGARRGYPALAAIIDSRDYLADTSKAPLYYTASGLPIYPARPARRQQVIAAGADAWRDYIRSSHYQGIDQAIKALASA